MKAPPLNLSSLFIDKSTSIRGAIECIDRNARSIALVVDPDRRLLGTISDGDIRRAIAGGDALDTLITVLLVRKADTSYPHPITAPVGISPDDLVGLMKKHVVRQIPILDEQKRVVDLITWEDLLPEQPLDLQAVVLAGGQATRLHPLAEDLPRPMLPLGNRPLLEYTIDQLRQSGIHHINLTTHYKPETIAQYFGDGKNFGVDIRYLEEQQPLGTAGSLSLLTETDEPILVVNGDVFTRVNYRAMLDFHREQNAVMTVAVRQHEFSIPYCVVDTDNGNILGVMEKPVIQRFINAGIYLLNPDVLDYIPSDRPYDMTNLLNQLVIEGLRVTSFPIHEYWLDIQEYEDYQQALMDVDTGIFEDLGVMQFEPGTPAPPGVISLCVPEIRGNEWVYIKECLDTNWVSSVGPFVTRFEEMLADYTGTKHGVATSTGTAALHIALLVAGVQTEDEVLVSALTFIAPANTVRYVGAWPIFVDAEPEIWQMDPQRVVDFLEKGCQWRDSGLYNKTTGRRVKAIIPVHVLGHPCDMDPIVEVARKYNLVLIEDATESLGGRYKGQIVGSLGDIACFSFNGNKIITTGGGGMLVTDNEAWARQARYLTTQAKDDPVEYIHNQIGYNYRLTNIQAAMGCAQMEKLPDFIQAKREITEFYRAELGDLPGLRFHQAAAWAEPACWLSNILVDESLFGMGSRGLMKALAEHGIQSRPLWHPLHALPIFRDCQSLGGEIAMGLYQNALSLPSSVGIERQDLLRIRDAFQHIYASFRSTQLNNV